MTNPHPLATVNFYEGDGPLLVSLPMYHVPRVGEEVFLPDNATLWTVVAAAWRITANSVDLHVVEWAGD